MKSFLIISLFLCLSLQGAAQDTVITIAPGMLPNHNIALGSFKAWFFKQGNDIAWAQKNIDITGWKKLSLPELLENPGINHERLEGWLRTKIKLDTAFREKAFYLDMSNWAASEMYVDGKLLAKYGNTGIDGRPFEEYRPFSKPAVDLSIQNGFEHVIAIHFVDYCSVLPPFQLKSATYDHGFIYLLTFEVVKSAIRDIYFKNIWFWVNLALCLLFWLLTFQNGKEKNLLLIAVISTFFTLFLYCNQNYQSKYVSFLLFRSLDLAQHLLVSFLLILALILVIRIFRQKITLLLAIAFCLVLISGIAQPFLANNFCLIFEITITTLICVYYIVISWKTLEGAQWAVLVGILLIISFGLALAILAVLRASYKDLLYYSLNTGLFLSLPLSLMVYVSMRFKEIIKEVRQNAQQVVKLSEEKKEQALNQQKILEEEVKRQTAELRNTLENLKATQAQLIQSEKMASLGELTAGIAHEIQNPLNFVNNFSEVNNELIEELQSERSKVKGERNESMQDEIISDIKQNLEKINHHGKRADAIVKGMLQHSRIGSGQKEPTDINALCDEYLRLAYHGMRAKDKSFNIEIKTDFDSSIGTINIVPQDIGRVVLNLMNNALYAVGEKKKQEGDAYDPTVTVSTKRNNGRVELRVSDNGNGIPQKNLDKIFQPFFTTKPTGQGTGLGLSLAYDIVKAHGGEIKVETKEGEGTIFTIILNG